MSKVENRPQVETQQAFAAAAQNNVNRASEEFKPVAATEETRQNRVERENDGGRRAERGGNARLCDSLTATVGDAVEIVDDEGHKRRGRVVRDDDGELTVTFDRDGDGKHDHSCHVNKHNGHCWGWRKATLEELEITATIAQMQRLNVIQEQHIESTIETAKVEHSRRLEDNKKTALREEMKQIETGSLSRQTLKHKRMDYNDALEIQFQTSAPDNEFESLSVSQVLLGQETADALKK